MIPINRARQNPKPPPGGTLQTIVQTHADGYRLSGRIAATALTGFDAVQYPRLGFFYAVVDRELGWQSWSIGQEFPVIEDPSLWGEAILKPASGR